MKYFDARDASSALNALHGRVILGVRLHLTLRDATSDTAEANSQLEINTNINLKTGATSASDEQIPFPHVETPASPTPTNPVGLPIPRSSAELFDPKSSHGHTPALERRLSVDSLLHELRSGGLHHSVSEQNLRMRAKGDVPHPFSQVHIPHFSRHQHSDAHFPADAYAAYTDFNDEVDAQTPTARPPRVKTPPQYIHARRISNIYHFDSVGKMPIPRTAPRPRSISVASDAGGPVAGTALVLEGGVGGEMMGAASTGGVEELESLAGRVAALEGSVMAGSPVGMDMSVGPGMEASPVAGRMVALPPYQGPLPVPVVSTGEEDAHWPREHSGSESEGGVSPVGGVYSAEQYYMAEVLQQQTYQPTPAYYQAQVPVSVPARLGPRRGHGGLGLEMTGERERERDALPERNKIDIGKIERGEETRTTVRFSCFNVWFLY